MKNVSLRDIAEELGVSKTLVSLVLNGKAKENRISQEVIDKVARLAKEKGYEPNQFAKALRTGKSKTIGLVVADIANPFFSKMARSIEDHANNTEYTVLFGSSDEDYKKADKLVKAMIDRQIEGLIISPTLGGMQNIELLHKFQVPYVLVDRPFPEIRSNFVGVDNFEASFHAVSKLIAEGRKNIAHITFNNELSHMNQRLDGYLKAHEKHGLSIDDSLIKYVSNDHASDEILAFISGISSRVDAFFFANNEIGLVALKCLQQLGKKINGELAITCFDDHDAFHLLNSSINVIIQPVADIGKEALKLLFDQIESKKELNRQIILPTSYQTLNEYLLKKQS
ncbi:unnamed protein product [Chrysoparadoxa australica]